jgi:hypothetical protein
MTNTKGDATQTDASPESTWGASPEAKEKWDRKHGAAARRQAKEEADAKGAK